MIIMAATIQEIHNSLVNGQRKQMVKQIDEYGLYDFWEDYKKWMYGFYGQKSAYEYFSDACISYHRIKNR